MWYLIVSIPDLCNLPYFTKRLSPIMYAPFVLEACAEVKMITSEPLFLVILDSRKAFDVVNHITMLDKLYECGLYGPL